jgi:small GTP-binding protein
VKSKGKKGVA